MQPVNLHTACVAMLIDDGNVPRSVTHTAEFLSILVMVSQECTCASFVVAPL